MSVQNLKKQEKKMSEFHEINPDKFIQSPFHLIGKVWQLICAESDGKVNAMTASWGGLGVMWGKNVAYIVLRPQRYTKELVDKAETFSLSFFGDCFRDMLTYMGTTSGRNEDKIAQSGLTVLYDGKTPYFEEATAVMLCKKMYAQKMSPDCFIDLAAREKWYPEKDYHTIYIAEIEKILLKVDL